MRNQKEWRRKVEGKEGKRDRGSEGNVALRVLLKAEVKRGRRGD